MIAFLIGAALAHVTAPADGAGPVVSIAARGGQVWASQIAAVPTPRDAIIAALPEGASAVALSEEARLALIRNRYPGARYLLRHEGAVRIVREAAIVAGGEAECAVARTAVAPGVYLTAESFAPARCRRGAIGGWLSYDAAARAFFARQAIPAGTYLGRLPASPPPSAIVGERVVYRTSEGPVTVEREVVALQSGRAGRPVFVRTEEGDVLSANLAVAEESE